MTEDSKPEPELQEVEQTPEIPAEDQLLEAIAYMILEQIEEGFPEEPDADDGGPSDG